MPRTRLFVLAVAWLLLMAAAATAETRYVNDQLIIDLRAAPNPESSVITTLKTDAPLEILADNGRFLKVRTEAGEVGYVLSQYVATALPKSLQLSRLTKERDELQRKLDQLEAAQGKTSSELAKTRKQQEDLTRELQAKLTATEQQLDTAQHQLSAATAKYEALQKDAGNVATIVDQRDRLQQENGQLKTELASLREENSSLLRTGMIQWFLAGGGVFFFGWLIGKLSRKKRRGF
jgi:SH3 domain protein